MNIAFAGLRHGHIFTIYQMAQENDLYRVVGAYEADEQARWDAAKQGVECNYASFAQLLADPQVQVVALGGCYGDRGAMAIQALNAGKHVIADKPLCTSLSELAEIEEAAKRNDRLVSCMFTMRFSPKINAVKKLVESGTLGTVNNVYFGGQHPLMYGRRPMWYFENGKHGGVINDIAIHGIDILSYALGLEISEIAGARCWNRYASREPSFKDSAQLMLVANNRAGILADVSYAIPDGIEFNLPYYWQFSIWGTKGMLQFSINEEHSFYYLSGSKEPVPLEKCAVATDYLTDFYRMTNGEDHVILPMHAVFDATRKTLEIQQHADSL
jgi:predicted dehydrogenase